VSEDEAAYLHRLAVRRAYAGRGISTAIFDWAQNRTRAAQRGYLRLDCESNRPQLRGHYEGHGFVPHSERSVGPVHVVRFQMAVSPEDTAPR